MVVNGNIYIIGRLKIEKLANYCPLNPDKCTLNILLYDGQVPTVPGGKSHIEPPSPRKSFRVLIPS